MRGCSVLSLPLLSSSLQLLLLLLSLLVVCRNDGFHTPLRGLTLKHVVSYAGCELDAAQAATSA